MLRKISALVLVLALIAVCLPGQAIIDVKAATDEENKHNAIIEQILQLDETISATKSDLQVVSLPKPETPRIQLSSNNDSEQAVRMVEQDGDTFEVTTIYPYVVTEDGDLVSSFEYTPKETRAYPVFNYNLVDTVVAVTVRYDAVTGIYSFPTFYRHLGVQAKWTSSNSTVSVSRMRVEYESYGDLHVYPDCLTASQYDSMIQMDYLVYSFVNPTNPNKGQVYSSSGNAMPENRILDFADGFSHGGLLTLNATYKVNGNTKTYSHQYDPYESFGMT